MATGELVSKAPLERVPIAEIQIGVRRRKKAAAKLASLQRSIADHGLIHPILLRNGNELVSGHRRLLACQELGWKSIPARQIDKLSDEELRAIELEENTCRVDLLEYEASKQRLAEMSQLVAKEKAGDLRKPSSRKGRPPEAESQRARAKAADVSRGTVQKLEKHVDLAEQYPFMQREGWAQYRALEAGKLVEKLPEEERPGVAVLLDQPGIPPKSAISILENLKELKPKRRNEIYEMARADDTHIRQQALAAAAKVPPMPDPGLMLLIDAGKTIKRAKQECRFKGHDDQFDALVISVDELIATLRCEAKAREKQDGK